MPNRYILFQAYGNPEILLECRFALMQLLQQDGYDTICVVLYTDNPSYFKNELTLFTNVIIKEVTDVQITEWRGKINFVHRVKIKILEDFFSNHAGSVLYCDTDTYCLKPITPLFDDIDKGILYMHSNEGCIKGNRNRIMKKWYQFLTSNETKAIADFSTNIDTITMWNAGVIGMHSQNAPMLKEVLSITDTLYPIFPRHTVEQFAFSYLFQKNATLLPADPFIFHYWNLKEYRLWLSNFYAVNSKLSVAMQAKKIDVLMPKKILHDKMIYKKTFFLKKLFIRKWAITNYLQEFKK